MLPGFNQDLAQDTHPEPPCLGAVYLQAPSTEDKLQDLLLRFTLERGQPASVRVTPFGLIQQGSSFSNELSVAGARKIRRQNGAQSVPLPNNPNATQSRETLQAQVWPPRAGRGVRRVFLRALRGC